MIGGVLRLSANIRHLMWKIICEFELQFGSKSPHHVMAKVLDLKVQLKDVMWCDNFWRFWAIFLAEKDRITWWTLPADMLRLSWHTFGNRNHKISTHKWLWQLGFDSEILLWGMAPMRSNEEEEERVRIHEHSEDILGEERIPVVGPLAGQILVLDPLSQRHKECQAHNFLVQPASVT